jgi:uncharacterized protein
VPGYVVKVIPQGATEATMLDLSNRVITFKFEDDEKKADKLTLTVDNFDLSNFDNPVWAEGNVLRASWGYEGNMALERELVIKKVTGSIVLTIEALAKSVLMNQQRKSRIFEQVKYSEIAHVLADEYGYEQAYQQIDDSEIIWPCVTQPGTTDAVFLRHLANKLKWEWYIDFDGFHFHPRRLGQRPIRTLTYYLSGDGEIRKFNITNDVTARPQGPTGAVQMKGRDPKEKKDINVTADNTNTAGRETNANVLKTVDARTGTRSYQKNNITTSAQSTTAPNEAAAKQQAKNAFTKAQQRTVKMTWDGPGDPGISAKTIVEMIFPGAKSITGKYYLSSVTHTLAANDAPYDIEVQCRRDGSTAVGGNEAKTTGKTNDQAAAAGGELAPRKLVDPRDGSRKTVFTDTRGRGVK